MLLAPRTGVAGLPVAEYEGLNPRLSARGVCVLLSAPRRLLRDDQRPDMSSAFSAWKCAAGGDSRTAPVGSGNRTLGRGVEGSESRPSGNPLGVNTTSSGLNLPDPRPAHTSGLNFAICGLAMLRFWLPLGVLCRGRAGDGSSPAPSASPGPSNTLDTSRSGPRAHDRELEVRAEVASDIGCVSCKLASSSSPHASSFASSSSLAASCCRRSCATASAAALTAAAAADTLSPTTDVSNRRHFAERTNRRVDSLRSRVQGPGSRV
eukprot:2906825-Rhodomonas_salina.1